MKFMSLVYGLVFFIVGAVIVLTVLPALLPTFYNGLNATNTYSYCSHYNDSAPTQCLTTWAMPLSALFGLNGILPLVVIAAVFVALVIGAIAMIKSKGK